MTITCKKRHDNRIEPALYIFHLAVSGGVQIGDYVYDKASREYYTVIEIQYN